MTANGVKAIRTIVWGLVAIIFIVALAITGACCCFYIGKCVAGEETIQTTTTTTVSPPAQPAKKPKPKIYYIIPVE